MPSLAGLRCVLAGCVLFGSLSLPLARAHQPVGSTGAWADHQQHFHGSRVVAGQDGPELICDGAGLDAVQARAFAQRLAMPRPATAVAGGSGSVFELIYVDPPGFGFFDNTPRAAVIGNPGTTLGEQRRAVLEAAANIWATWLDSPLPLRVEASFIDLGCTSGAAGVAGPSAMLRNFSNAPLLDTPYPAPLATALNGARFSGLEQEMHVYFNSRLEEEGCFSFVPDGFWYGLDYYAAPAPRGYSFLDLALHEFGHGLGFVSTLDPLTGQFDGGLPDAYAHQLHSRSLQRPLTSLSLAERNSALALGNDLVWTGAAVTARLPEVLFPPAQVRIESGTGAIEAFPAAFHGFAPFLPAPGLSGRLVVAANPTSAAATADGGRRADDACEALSNGGLPPNSVLLASGAGCTHADKWRHAHAAGASALLLIDPLSNDQPTALARIGMALPSRQPIPIWTVDRIAGQRLLATAQSIRSIHLGYTDDPPAGTSEGRLIVHPSVSHLSQQTSPRLLMGTRSASGGMFGLTDLSTDLLYDLGWPGVAARKAQFGGSWFNPERSGEGCLLTLEGNEQTFILTCYFNHLGAQAWVIGDAQLNGTVLDFDPVYVTSGARYGAAFDPADVQRDIWGRIRVNLIDCNTAVLDLWPALDEYARFQSRMRKIVAGDCQRSSADQPDRSLAGSYFAPNRSGEGIQLSIEADEQTAILAFYSYDEGQQLWAFGDGRLADDRVEFDNVVITRGADYGPEFDPTSVQRVVFGDIAVRWLDCNDIELTIEPVLEGFAPTVQPMTRIVQRSCD